MRKFIACFLTIFALAPAAALAGTCSLAGLSWMAGNWVNADNPIGAQERWAIAPGGVLMGSSWEFPKGNSGYAEIMTIRADGAALSMFLRHFDGGLSKAWEDRADPMLFVAARCEPSTVAFDGQGEHAGEHMTYARSGNNLRIVADFLHHGTPVHEEWRMTRAND